MKRKTNLIIILLFLIAMTFSNCLMDFLFENIKYDRDPSVDSTNGLYAEYFHNTDLSNLAFTKVDREINFDWENGPPNSSIGTDNFSVRWTGYIKPEYNQEYTFHTISDDGVRLLVDNKVIVDNWTVHAPTENSGTISLQANKYYSIQLEYYETYGGATIKLFWSGPNQPKEIIPSTNLFNDDNLVPGKDVLEYGLRNTILVPMPMNTSSTWKDLAFLAAVPAGMKINSGRPSVIAMPDNEDINEYHYNYLDRYKPTNVFAIGNVPGYSGAVQLNSSSLDDLTCDLARFWQKSDTVVIVQPSYHMGLATSALAARLNVPLFFKNNGTISAKTMDSFNKLGVKKVICVGGSNDIAGQLNGAGIGIETIPSIEKIIPWLVANGHVVDYFAVCNSYDRTNTYAPRSSLAAPILAAGRNGVVVPLIIPVEFQTRCVGLTETQSRPNGAAMSQPYQGKTSWKVGSCTVNGKNYNVALSRRWADKDYAQYWSQGNIDFNGDGDYSDNGEYFVTGDKRNFGGKEYLIGLPSWENPADLRVSSPDANVFKAAIQTFHNSLGHHPKYMALVGLPDALPPLRIYDPRMGQGQWWTDHIYSDVDSDPMFDIAIGRIVGENASIFTLAATRAITYRDLLDSSWMNRAVAFGHFTYDREQRKKHLENRGFLTDSIPKWEDVDRTKYNFYVHEDHGWAFGIGPVTNGPTPPVVVTTSGCSFGQITNLWNPFAGKFMEYKDFGAVQLARTGSVAFFAYGINANGFFDINRDNFNNALFYQDATLGEAHLYAQNSGKMLFEEHPWDIQNLNMPMLYGDPALKIHLPSAQPKITPARVEVSGNTATLIAPGNLMVTYFPNVDDRPWNHKDMPYDFRAPGLTGAASYSMDPGFKNGNDKRFIAKFTVNGSVTNITQQSGIPDHLGWFYDNADTAYEYRVDNHWDGSSTVYINARFYIFNYYNGKIDNSVSKISYSLTGDGGTVGNFGPAGYTWCAKEGGSFTLPGNCDVAYGANGTFKYLSNKTGTIAFNNSTFGDPTPGAPKDGYYKKIAAGPNAGNSGPAGYTWCAKEGGSFALPGNCDVAYGANGTFKYLSNKTGTITFNNSTFGDPTPGVQKDGYYKLTQQGDTSEYYKITVKHSGRVLDVSEISQSNGAQIHQWDWWNGDNQKWYLQSLGNGYYEIKAKHSGQCLDVSGGSKNDGANITQWTCHGGDNQIFKIVDVGDGYNKIIAKHSGKCLDVYGAIQGNGVKIIQWTCHGGDNQKFNLDSKDLRDKDDGDNVSSLLGCMNSDSKNTSGASASILLFMLVFVLDRKIKKRRK